MTWVTGGLEILDKYIQSNIYLLNFSILYNSCLSVDDAIHDSRHFNLCSISQFTVMML